MKKLTKEEFIARETASVEFFIDRGTDASHNKINFPAHYRKAAFARAENAWRYYDKSHE